MPNKWPITSGNWSTASIWNGGTKPGVGDDVFANNQSVYIDENVTVRTLNNAGTTGISSSGQFFLNNGVTVNSTNGLIMGQGAGVTLIQITGSNSASIQSPSMLGYPGPTIILQNSSNLDYTGSINKPNVGAGIQHNSSGVLNVLGNVSANVNGSQGILFTGTGTLNVIGTVTGGSVSTAPGISKTTNAGTIRVLGNVVSGAGSDGYGIGLSVGSIVIITGSVISNASNAIRLSNGNATINISGNVETRGTLGAITLAAGTSTLTITGSVYQLPTSTSSTQINIGGTRCDINISGSVSAGLTAAAISHTAAGSSSIQGPISASIGVVGVAFSNASHILTATGPFYNTNNRNAVFAQNLQLISGSTPTWQFDTETFGGTKILYTSGSVAGYPSTSNVRNGVIYGDTNQFTGTVVIPAASNVIRGALVDNTTGSASFTTQNAWSAATGSLTVSGSIGARLRNIATVNTDAALITTRRKL